MSEMEINFSDVRGPSTPGSGIPAKYDGFCKECGEPIWAGTDLITYAAEHDTYVHISCYREPAPYSDPKPADFCPICWQARAANGTCGCL